MKKTVYLLLLSGALSAQTYQTPIATEYPFPSGNATGSASHSSSYLFNDMTLAAYDDGTNGEVIWQRINTGGPSMACGGTFNYSSGYSFIEVGALNGTVPGGSGPFTAFVAYHQSGVGHAVDLYDWDPGACNMTYMTTHTLSTNPNPSRISMDNHIEYALSIAWTDGTALRTAVYEANIFTPSPIHTIIPSVSGPINVDVAFTHAMPHMNPPGYDLVMHYVYTTMTSPQQVEVCALDFWTLRGAGGPTTYIPVYEDLNRLNRCSQTIFPNMDGADHEEYNWAYAYTEDNSNISVRLRDWTNSVPPTTFVVNDGTMGNTPNNGAVNRYPTLAYNWWPDQINVGWVTSDAGQSYVGLKMASDGTAITSTLDYLQIPNNPALASPTPTLAYSKMTEFSYPWLYVFFSEWNGGLYDFQHKYHDMSINTNFKTTPSHTVVCSYYQNQQRTIELESIEVYPVPVSDEINIVSDQLPSDQLLDVSLTDITGRVVIETNGDLEEINTYLNSRVGELTHGSYLLKITAEDGHFERTWKIHKD